MSTGRALPFLLAALTFGAHAVEGPRGSVRGVIYNEEGRPKSGALVMGSGKSTETDEAGHFRIDGIPVGRQYFHVLHWGMREATFDVTIVAGDTISIKPIYMRPFGLSDSQAAAESIGVDVPWASGALTCKIWPARKPFHVGDHPEFRVSITNHGKQPLNLVYVGSGAFPRASIHLEVRSLAVGHILPSHSDFLGGRGYLTVDRTDGVSVTDFIRLEPGQAFDPFRSDSNRPASTRTFQLPGTYRATFTYSTKQPDVRQWLGFGQSTVDSTMSQLFRSVPLIELSDSTEFEVVD